jgi:hypothetical protein
MRRAACIAHALVEGAVVVGGAFPADSADKAEDTIRHDGKKRSAGAARGGQNAAMPDRYASAVS